MQFLLFSILFCGVIYLHFAMAHRAWRAIRGHQSPELDMTYVRMEDYFGHSFRLKLKEWMRLLRPAPGSTAGLTVYDKGNERIFVARGSSYPAGRVEKEILVVEGDFSCGRGCSFEKELMVKGDCVVGDESNLQAVAVDGALTLGEGVSIRRWVDGRKSVVMMADSAAGSRVTSRHSIEFLPGAHAPMLYAPEVFTEGRQDTDVQTDVEPAVIVQVPHGADDARAAHGYDPAKLFAMGGGTYLYHGDLHVTQPLHLRAPLVVRGDFSCARESLLESDLKAHGTVTVGNASVIKGNISSGSDMALKPNTYFLGLLQAGGAMRISRGARGLRNGTPVAAHAEGVVTLESNVVVNGKISSAHRVVAISTPAAWLDSRK